MRELESGLLNMVMMNRRGSLALAVLVRKYP